MGCDEMHPTFVLESVSYRPILGLEGANMSGIVSLGI